MRQQIQVQLSLLCAPDGIQVTVTQEDESIRPNIFRLAFDDIVQALVVDDSLVTTTRPPHIDIDTLSFNQMQTVTVEAAGGTFRLDTRIGVTIPLAFDASADKVRQALVARDPNAPADELLPLLGANNVTVTKLKNVEIRAGRFASVYLIGYRGELRGTAGQALPRLSADTSALELGGVAGAGRVGVAVRTDGLNYYNVETLNVGLGLGDDRFKVRGTLATTTLDTSDGDDVIYVASGADLSRLPDFTPAVGDLEALHDVILHADTDSSVTQAPERPGGTLDFVEGTLTIEAGPGQNSLSISDRHNFAPDSAVVITDAMIDGLAPATINYQATGGDFSGQGRWTLAADVGLFARGVNIYGGTGGNAFDVRSTHQTDTLAVPFPRTITTLFTGDGNDTLTASVADDPDRMFVVQAWQGNDLLDASGATLPVVIFGDEENDTVRGGASADVLFGDRGRLYFLRPDGDSGFDVVLGGEPRAEHLAWLADIGADVTFTTADLVVTVDPAVGGSDQVQGNGDSDIMMGGRGDDTLIGDNAESDPSGNPGVFDLLETSPGMDVLIGDQGRAVFFAAVVRRIETLDAQPDHAGDDRLEGNDLADVLLAGAGDDTIFGEAPSPILVGNGPFRGPGDDIVLADVGIVRWDVAATGDVFIGDDDPLTLDLVETGEPELGGSDTVFAIDGADIVLAGAAGDVVLGDLYGDVRVGGVDPAGLQAAPAPGSDTIIGDAGRITLFNAVVTLIRTIEPSVGGDDVLQGDDLSDIVLGGAGNDTLYGESPQPQLALIGGRGGDDTLLGDNGRLDYVLGADSIEARPDVALHLGGTTTVALDADPATLDRITTTDPTLGGDDTIFGSAGNDVIFGGTGRDRLAGDTDDDFAGLAPDGADGNDLIFGDHAVVFPSLPAADPFFVNNNFFAIDISASDAGSDDAIFANGGDDTILGQQGDDVIFGGSGNDVVIGGHNVVGGHDELDEMDSALRIAILSGLLGDQSAADINDFNDVIDGGSGDDVIAGDNAIIVRQADSNSPRYRQLVAPTLYTINTAMAGGEEVDLSFTPNVGAAAELKPESTLGRTILLLEHTGEIALAAASAPLDPRVFGNDVIAGGADDDELFGQLGDDIMQGDGSLRLAAGAPVPFDASPLTPVSFTVPDDQGSATYFEIDGFTLLFDVSESTTDADDYLEGNGGNDRLYGGLGQDDLVGGSSTLFGLDAATAALFGVDPDDVLRPDGSDSIYGGAADPTRLARNAVINPTAGDATILGDEAHARDADTIVGDNGNIHRIVNGAPDPADYGFETFVYDQLLAAQNLPDGYSTLRPLIPRAVELLDYGYDAGSGGVAFRTDSIGMDDLLHGESGDDVIFGMTGNDVVFGDAGDDDLYGQQGHDRIYAGSGEDGVVSDEGLIFTSRNGQVEPLHALTVANAQTSFSIPGPFIGSTEFITGRLSKSVDLLVWNHGYNDVVYGGLGDDFIHAGAGDDAISGAEALSEFYTEDRVTNFNSLQYDPATRKFAAYDAANPRQKIAGFFLNFDAFDENDEVIEDGQDRIFGDLGNDWLVGGTGRDRLFGSMGDDYLQADDDLDTNGGANDVVDDRTWGDFVFGGGGLDVLIGNTGHDRLIDWLGEFNTYLVPFSKVGDPTVTNLPSPEMIQFLRDLGRSSGADQTRSEPAAELGLVTREDPEWDDQRGSPRDPQIPGRGRMDDFGVPEDDSAQVPTVHGSTPGSGGDFHQGGNQTVSATADSGHFAAGGNALNVTSDDSDDKDDRSSDNSESDESMQLALDEYFAGLVQSNSKSK